MAFNRHNFKSDYNRPAESSSFRDTLDSSFKNDSVQIEKLDVDSSNISVSRSRDLNFVDTTGSEIPEAQGTNVFAIIVTCFAAFGGILFGYDTGIINGVLGMKYFVNNFAKHVNENGEKYLKSSEKSLIVSLLSVGTFVGALLSAPLGDRIGRRLGLIFSCGVFSIGVALQTGATEQVLFIIGRVIAGLGVGMSSGLVPLYQSEAAPKHIRGAIVSFYQFAITVGLLIAACVNKGTENLENSGSYRIPVGLQLLWASILSVGMFILPETPRYLIKRGKYEEAAISLGRLRSLPASSNVVKAELEEIQANYNYELSLGGSTYADCFKNKGRQLKRIITGCGIQALQQLTGINFIFYYGTTFFQSAGIENAFLISLITNIVNVIATIPGLYFVDKFGRRNLLMAGGVGMCVSEYIVAIVGTVKADSDAANKVLIAFVCIFIACFACSWGPTAWVVTGEIFSLRVRAKSLSITTASNWILNFVIGFITPYLVDSGPGNANLGSKVFFIWGTCNFACIAWIYFLVYETKNKSLEEIDTMYEEISWAPDSVNWVPRLQHAQTEFNDFSAKREGAHIEAV